MEILKCLNSKGVQRRWTDEWSPPAVFCLFRWITSSIFLLPLLPAVWPHVHVDTVLSHCPASAKPPLLPASHHCASFLLLILSFYGRRLSASPSPLHFLPLTRSAVKCISIPGSFFFSLCGIQECYCNHLAEWQGHARASFTIKSSLLEHFCSRLLHKGHILIFSYCLFVTSSPISPYLLSLPMYTSFSPFSPHCQPRHLPASPPPSQSEECSVDIGFCPNM